MTYQSHQAQVYTIMEAGQDFWLSVLHNDCVTLRAKLGHFKISSYTKGSNKGGKVMGREETRGQYVESKISVFFLSRENYLQPCTSWLLLSRLCFADTIDTK